MAQRKIRVGGFLCHLREQIYLLSFRFEKNEYIYEVDRSVGAATSYERSELDVAPNLTSGSKKNPRRRFLFFAASGSMEIHQIKECIMTDKLDKGTVAYFDQELEDALWEGAITFDRIAQDALKSGDDENQIFFTDLSEDFLHDLQQNC